MTFDDTYIEMCRKAVEIQEQWEPKAGDMIIRTHTVFGEEIDKQIWDSTDSIEILVRNKITYDTHWWIVTDKDKGGTMCLMEDDLYTKTCKWIPRQEDLQDIYFNNIRVDDFYSSELSNYAREFGLNEFGSDDLTTLWLVYVMRELYGKIWDEEKKKWIMDWIEEIYGI